MAVTPSNMLPLGVTAPDFRLPDAVSGKTLSLSDLKGKKGTVVMFICNHCPFVKHVNSELVRLAKDYEGKGASFIAISSNDAAAYPEDAPPEMAAAAKRLGYPFPYLYDASQDVARAYQAACTPDFYLFDGALSLVYRGRLDGSTPGNGVPLDGKDLRAALDALLANVPIDSNQKASVGCNIKWKR